MNGYSDYLDFYRRGPYEPYLKEHRLAGSTPVRLLCLAQPAGHYPDAPTPDVTIQIADRSSRHACVDAGAGRWQGRMNTGDVWLGPADTAADYILDDDNAFLVAAMPRAALRSAIAEVRPDFTGDFGRLHAAPFLDPLVESLCRRLWDEAEQGSPLGSLFADSALQTLALALLRRAEAEPEPARATPLAPWRLKRCLAYMGENLDQDIGLAELAAAAGLSTFHFSRAFKQATGLAPHRYLIAQRVGRAKELLANADLPLAEVALACGFAHQSHLTSAFKRAVGVAPGTYRTERLT